MFLERQYLSASRWANQTFAAGTCWPGFDDHSAEKPTGKDKGRPTPTWEYNLKMRPILARPQDATGACANALAAGPPAAGSTQLRTK